MIKTICIITLIINAISLLGYIGWYISVYGIPKSISDTWNNIKKENKVFYYLALLSSVFSLIYIGGMLLPNEGDHLNLMGIGGSMLTLVPACANFLGRNNKKWINKLKVSLHMIGAFGGYGIAALSFWISYDFWIGTIFMVLVATLSKAFITKNAIFWIETNLALALFINLTYLVLTIL